MNNIFTIFTFVCLSSSFLYGGDAGDVLSWLRLKGLGESHPKIVEVKSIISGNDADQHPVIINYLKTINDIKDEDYKQTVDTIKKIEEDRKVSTSIYGTQFDIKGVHFAFTSTANEKSRERKLNEVYRRLLTDVNLRKKIIGIHPSENALLITVLPRDFKELYNVMDKLKSNIFQVKGINPTTSNGKKTIELIQYPKHFTYFFAEKIIENDNRAK